MTPSRTLVLAVFVGFTLPLAQGARAADPEPPATATTECPLHATHMADGAASAAAHDHHAAVRARGDVHMGFPQDATTHHFRLAADGGAIEVTANDPADAELVARVRGHLRHIAAAFAAGDFRIPEAVHAGMPPGAAEMAAAGAAIDFRFAELPAGGRVQVVARDEAALAAVHDFLRFQIADHDTDDPAALPQR